VTTAAPGGTAGVRLARLYLISRHVPAALAVIVFAAGALWIALHRPWDAYGALQLPLIFETGCAAVIAATSVSPFGEPERATGRWPAILRAGTALAMTAAAGIALSTAGIGVHLAGGTAEMLRNLVGLTGLGLLGAALLRGSLAWTALTAYLVVAIYALYTQWHGPALTSPWIWPARPAHDIGAVLCAGAVFVVGLVAITLRGARPAADG
jgi:hypothetical protein